jgi:hypothetical protein
MELHLPAGHEAQLADIARHQGITVEALLAEIVRGLLEEDDCERDIIQQRIRIADNAHLNEEKSFDEAVRVGLAQADAGRFIEEEEMEARFEKMMRG